MVGLKTTPAGPVYPAASWITFHCNASSGSGLYSYQWKVYCSSTGLLVYSSDFSSSNTFEVKSTPSLCYDEVECVVEDKVLPAIGASLLTVNSITGIV